MTVNNPQIKKDLSSSSSSTTTQSQHTLQTHSYQHIMKVPLFAFIVQIILLAGATMLLVFIILSGTVNHFPFNKFYWLEADTSNITNAPDMSRWTFWGLSTVSNGKNVPNTSSPAYPLSPLDNFDTTTGVPSSFIDNRDVYFYLSRVAFGLFWAALAFTGVSFIISLFTLCSYSIVKLNGWLVTIAFIAAGGAVAMMTAVVVMAKSAFSGQGDYAHLGPALLGISWATVACLLILFFLAWGELIGASYKKHRANVAATKAAEREPTSTDAYPPAAQPAQTEFEDPYAQPQQPQALGNESGIKFFKIRRHNKEDQESV